MNSFQKRYKKLGDDLYLILSNIKALEDADNRRIHLLRNLPPEQVQLVKHHSAFATDLQIIIDTVVSWEQLEDSRLGLTILAESALSIVGNLRRKNDLKTVIADLEVLAQEWNDWLSNDLSQQKNDDLVFWQFP